MISSTKSSFYLLLLSIACSYVPASINGRHNTNIDSYEVNAPALSRYKVVGIKDGDTFVLLINGREQVVRLAHIDCPEKKQPFGAKAKQFASDLCFGKQVTLLHNKKYDRNKRLIAEIILKDGRNVNKELVGKGLAWHFKKYSNDRDYAALEIKARTKRIGIWSDNAAVAPWKWRGRSANLS